MAGFLSNLYFRLADEFVRLAALGNRTQPLPPVVRLFPLLTHYTLHIYFQRLLAWFLTLSLTRLRDSSSSFSVPDDYKVNPGPVEAIAQHPTDEEKVRALRNKTSTLLHIYFTLTEYYRECHFKVHTLHLFRSNTILHEFDIMLCRNIILMLYILSVWSLRHHLRLSEFINR